MRKTASGQSNLLLKILALSVVAGLLIPSFGFGDSIVANQNQITKTSDYTRQTGGSKQLTTHSVVTSNGMLWENYGEINNLGRPAEVYMTQSDLAGLTISSEFFGFWKYKRNTSIELFDRIEIPGLVPFADIGKPILPRLITYVEVPKEVNIGIQSIEGSNAIIADYDYQLAPAQPPASPVWTPDPADSVELVFDEDVYGESSFYPSFGARLVGESSDSAIIMRGRRLLEISFYPISYNPQSKDIMVYSNFVLRLNYSQPAQFTPPRAALRCEQFENIFERFLLNYRSWGETVSEGIGSFPGAIQDQFFPASNGFGTTACENLIIVYDDFLVPAMRLAQWKNRTGLLTRVYTTTQVMNSVGSPSLTSNVIRTFIQSAYHTWRPSPTYVLLFGDSNHIPTNYDLINKAPENSHGPTYYYDQTAGFIGSDLSYFTLDGNDYIPDLFYGRISVDSLENASVIVNKTLKYEQTPPNLSSFYRNIFAAGFFEDEMDAATQDTDPILNGDGIEDYATQFIQESEAIKRYLQGLTDHDYIVHVNYTANVTDGHNPPFEYYNGRLEVDYSGFPESFHWMSLEEDAADYAISNITSNFNDGRFLVYHLDHGGSWNMYYCLHPNRKDYAEGWIFPRFNTSHVKGLTNGDLLPLVIDIDCSTGWFDGETDEYAMGDDYHNYAGDCLAEILHRKKDGGAIAVIAASRIVFNYDSAALLNGTINAIWPGTEFSEYLFIHPIYEMGAALYYGKMNVLRVSGYEDSAIDPDMSEDARFYKVTNSTFHLYHLFGDPSTPLWTEEPSELFAEYPLKIGSQGTQRFVVNVYNESGDVVENAKVCIQKGNEAYEVGYTNTRGYVEFQVTNLSGGDLNVTVTKHNFIPHIGTIEVVESDATIRVSPARQKSHQSVDIDLAGFNDGQLVFVYFGNQKISPDHVYTSPSTTASVEVPEGNDGLMTVVANQTSNGPVATTTFYRLSDTETDLKIKYIHVFPYIETTLNNIPTTVVAGTTTNPSQLVAIDSYQIYIRIRNEGPDDTSDSQFELFYHEFGVGQARQRIFVKSGIEIKHQQELGIDVDWTPVETGHICLIAKVSDRYDLTSNNDEYWQNTHVLGVSSPGNVSFAIGNNKTTAEYASVELIQEGNYSDYWNATIHGFSSRRMDPKQNESVQFIIDVPDSVPVGEWRVFTVVLSIKGEYVESLSINVTKVATPPTTEAGIVDFVISVVTSPIFIASVVIIVVVLILYLRSRRK